MSTNYYAELAKVNVNEHVEKKGKFSYLSWPFAIDTLKKAHPDATWDVIRHEGVPYIKTELGYFVEVAVTVNGITHSQIHPVLDNNNRPINQPNSFQINTSIQRALVKAIALHGLGLYIYAGEDLPEVDGDDVAEAPATPKANGTSATTAAPSAREKAIAAAKEKAQAKAAAEAKQEGKDETANTEANESVEPINKGQINAINNMVNLISRKKGITTAEVLAPSLSKLGKADLNDLTFEEAKLVVIDLNQAMKG